MKKNFGLFVFFMAMLVLPAFCQASTTILTSTLPDHTVTSGSDEHVYGTSASNQIILESGAKAELINFPGQNNIQIQSSSEHFTMFRSGTIVTFQGREHTVLKIPATTDPQTITFSDSAPLTLSLYNNQVMLDDQMIGTTPANIGAGHVAPDEENDFELILEGSEDNVVSVFPGNDLELKISAVPLSLDEGEDSSFFYQIVASDLPTATIDNDGNITARVPDDLTAGTALQLTIQVFDATLQIKKDLVVSIYVMAQTVVTSNVVDSQGGTVSDPTDSVKVEVPPGAFDIPAQIDIIIGEEADGRQAIRFWTDSESTETITISLEASPERNVQHASSPNMSTQSLQLKSTDNDFYDFNGVGTPLPDHAWYIRKTFRPNFFRLPGREGEKTDIDLPTWTLPFRVFKQKQTFRLKTAATGTELSKDNVEPVIFIHGHQPLGELGGGSKYWGNFLNLMNELKINDKEFIVFDYQWRTDSRFQDAAYNLYECIKKIYTLTGNKKVHIIAHSFGGVLARSVLQKLYDNSFNDNPTDHIASFISFGSPHSGIFSSPTTRNTLSFPDGQHGIITEAGRNITVYQMGENVNYGDLKQFLGIEDTPGEIAWHLANTIHRIPSEFPMTIGISTIAWTEIKNEKLENQVLFPEICFSEGDGLISLKGQRFFPTLSTGALLSTANGNQTINGHALNVNEIILGFKEDIVPSPFSITEIWDVTDLTHSEIKNEWDLIVALGNLLNYKHYPASGLLIIDQGGFASNVQTEVNCDNVDNCTHEAFVHTKSHLTKVFADASLELDKTQVTLQTGESTTVIVQGGTGYYSNIESSNGSVATATLGANDIITIVGLSTGTATITAEDTGGKSASISVTVTTTSSGDCGAYVAPGVWKEFNCYNLAAIGKTTNDDPFSPSWRLIGGYWQWGWKGPDPSQWYYTNTSNFAHGPTGLDAEDANSGSISGWDDEYAPDGVWSDSEKTGYDPCPVGYRVPTIAQWEGVLNNNTQSTVGTWSNSATDYGTARLFGSDLMLPAAGYRGLDGALLYRGHYGHYWSSSENGSYYAGYLYFGQSGYVGTGYGPRGIGPSVRCIAEDSQIGLIEDFSNFNSNNYHIIGDAHHDSLNNEFVLTESERFQKGRIFWKQKVLLDRWSVEFDFRMSNAGGLGGGADGITFSFVKDYNYPQSSGSYLDFDGADGYAVEFDNYYFEIDPYDFEHVALIKNKINNHLAASEVPSMKNGNKRHVRIEFDNGLIEVWMDGIQYINNIIKDFSDFEGYMLCFSKT